MSRVILSTLALAALLLTPSASATNYTVTWDSAAVATQCRALATSNNYTWVAPNETVWISWSGDYSQGTSGGFVAGTIDRAQASAGTAVFDATRIEESPLGVNSLDFSGCCAYDDYKPSGAILPGESDGCAPGSQFDVEPKSVILSVPTSTFTPDPVPSTTAAPASTSAAPTTTSAAPVSTTTTRPAAAGRVGGSFVDKVVALAGAAAVVAVLGA